jgi:hypothetical protein
MENTRHVVAEDSARKTEAIKITIQIPKTLHKTLITFFIYLPPKAERIYR